MAQNSEKQLPLKNHYRDYLETLIEQFLQYLESGNQPVQLSTRIAVCSFGQLFLLEKFLVLKLSFLQVALSILPENSGEEQA